MDVSEIIGRKGENNMIRVELNVAEDANIWRIRNAMVLMEYEESKNHCGFTSEMELLHDTVEQIDEYFGDMFGLGSQNI